MNEESLQLDEGRYESFGERAAPRWIARLFLPFLVLTSMLPPLALAAPSPSQLAQVPPFVDAGAQPNVMFIMDDSLSMDDIRLPVPAGINPGESTGGDVAVRGRASTWTVGAGWTVGAAVTVPRVNEWIFRTSTLNPLYYNPNIRYQPWNDNGRLGTVTPNTYPASSTAVDTQATGWRAGRARHDMRYAGPNRTAANFSATELRPDVDANRGSNPPDVPSYLAAGRPSKGGFDSGAAVGGKNYDLFSSPSVLVSGSSTNICLVAPTSPSTTGLPTQARPSIALPTQPRDSQARSSSALPTTSRTTFNRGSQALPQTTRTAQTRPIYSVRPSAARPSVGRGSVPLGETTRTITPLTSSALPVAPRTVSARDSQPLPQTARTVTARSSQALATQARGLTNQPVEYSWRVGDCITGAWSAWTTVYVAELCSNSAGGEGSVIFAPFQTRYQPCAAGTAIAGGAQCLLDCPAGFTPNPGNPAQCLGTCPGTFPALISGTCYADCAAGTSINPSDNTQCLSDCPGGQTPSANPLVCQGACPGGFGALIGTVCYADACPGGTTIHSNAAQCISDCTSGMTIDAGNPLQCVGTCPGGEPNRVGYVCYSTCPGGSAVDPGNAARCLSNCPGGQLPVAGSNPPICRETACPGGFPTLSGTTCFANCPAGNTVVLPGQPGTCYADACPAGTPSVSGDICLLPCDAGTVLIGATCYQPSCLAGFSVNPGNATQCLSDCPVGQAVISSALCEGTCSGGFPNRIGTTCYADCSVTEPVVNSSNPAQCLSTCPAGQTATVGNPLVCVGACAGGFPSLIGTTCYANCSGGYPTISPLDNTQCLADCNAGYTVDPINALQCLGSCPPTRPNQVGNTCYRDCTGGFPNVNPLNVGQCQGPCPAGWTQSGTQCQQCAAGSTLLSNGQCCPIGSVGQGNCPANRPAGMPCTDNTYVPDLDTPALARYYVFAPNPAIATPTGADYGNPANYVQVDINRDFTLVLFPKAADRTDCAAADSCTRAEEMQNFANWYSYYRTRLFSAIAVTAQSLSGLTNASGKNQIRLGYGSINYFPNGFNPYAASDLAINNPRYSTSTSTVGSPAELDGQASAGHIVRGVRPFNQVGNPNVAGSIPAVNADDRRQEVFNWLFSLRGTGSTPNREALDAVGQYYERTDNKGPWIEPDAPTVWSTSASAAAHISCRRTYSILITDGEWTNAPYVSAAPQQPVLGRGGNTFPTDVTTTMGPAIAGNPAGLTYQYNPAALPQFSTNGNPTVGSRTADRTLTDVALYYWNQDLRTDLQNNIDVVPATPSKQGDPAFWQHMVPYIVGYGISASMESAATRSAIINSANNPSTPTAVNWPSVIMERRPADNPGTIVTDRDTTPVNCDFNATGTAQQRSGCGRVDDTMRAALAARGDFLAATNVSLLAQSIANVFDAIGEREGSGSALAARSSSIRAGDRLFYASFFTNSWIGRVTSFDAVAYATAIVNNTPEPSTSPNRVVNTFPAPGSRNIFTSNGVLAAGTSFPTVAADMANLDAAQQAALGTIDLARYVRGFQDRENRNGGPFRNRGNGEIMADIINSAPLYAKAPDQFYSSQRRPAGGPATGTDASTNAYRVHVNRNKQYRPATLFVGSNSGKVHAFDVSGSPVATLPNASPNPDYNANYMIEKFAYVPRAVYSKFAQLSSPTYTHQYLMDGQVVEGDIYDGGAWKTVLVGTTGAGPKGVFALDVTLRTGTVPTAFSASNVIWDIAGTDSVTNIDDLGNIMAPGVIGSGKDGGWYYFTGNGYESTNDKARLLAICLGGTCTKGDIFSIATDNFGGSNTAVGAPLNQRPNGLGGITPVYDGNRNIVAIYGGDRLGRLWKFDLSSTARASWASATTTTPLFEAVNGASERQPITAAPRVFAYPLGGRMIVFGTGKLMEQSDRANGEVQSIYAVREENITSPTAVSKAQLRQLTLTETTSAGLRLRVIGGTSSFNPSTDRGWYFDLTGTGIAVGERIISSPYEQFGFANITSYTPVGLDLCKPGGQSFFYRLDVAFNFTRLPFQGYSLTTVATEVPPTVAPANTVNQRSNETSATQGSISGTSLGSFAAGPSRSAATNPCAGPLGQKALVRSVGNKGGSAPASTCPNPALRVWRDLPNTINRN